MSYFLYEVGAATQWVCVFLFVISLVATVALSEDSRPENHRRVVIAFITATAFLVAFILIRAGVETYAHNNQPAAPACQPKAEHE